MPQADPQGKAGSEAHRGKLSPTPGLPLPRVRRGASHTRAKATTNKATAHNHQQEASSCHAAKWLLRTILRGRPRACRCSEKVVPSRGMKTTSL